MLYNKHKRELNLIFIQKIHIQSSNQTHVCLDHVVDKIRVGDDVLVPDYNHH